MADVTIGAKLEADGSQYIQTVGNIKKELKLAQAEVIKLTDKFGATSAEVAGVARYAAELKDKIQDANQLVDAFNPDTKFKAFGASIQTVVGGFTALTGAMGLLGVESEEVQKTLLKVQSALALSQGIAQLQEGMQAFKNFGAVMLNTLGTKGLLGIAIAGVAALGLAIAGVFDGTSRKTRELNNSLKELAKGELEATKEVAQLKNAFKQAELGIISKDEALKKYNEGIGKTIGLAKDYNEAEKLTVDNAENYIKVQGLKAQANYILGKSAEIAAQAVIDEATLAKQKLGSDPFGIRGGFQAGIDANKKEAQDLMGLITGINQQIADASKGFKTPGAPEAKKETAANVKTEQAAINLEYLTAGDQRIQHALDIQKKLAANRGFFIEEARVAEEAEFQEKIALLNLELEAEENANRKRIQLAEAEGKAKEAIAQATADTLGSIADLIGRDTAAGKVLAIASATINTYLGASKAIAQGGIFGTIAAIGVIAAGLAQVKNIIAVKLPPKYDKGAGSSVGVASAPLIPALPTSTNTRLDRDQLNQIGNAAVRAYVVEHDVSSNIERVRRTNRAARIG